MTQRNRSFPLKPGNSRAALTITQSNAAGIDIGSASHFVAVPLDRDDQPVREFPSFTVDLNVLADWLDACGVDTVAMESTGVYWIPLFELLVNARHVKNVSGRKFDVLDCQWLQQLMTYGLLSGAFRPVDAICVLRSLWRQRGMLLRSQARDVQPRLPPIGHFASWLSLCPGTKITGDKVMSGKTRRVANRAAQALRLAAAALRSNKSALGAYFRRVCSRMDKPKAVTAAAHKLARLIYTMLTNGQEYTDQGQDYYEQRYRERVLRQLTQRANKMGMKLIAVEQAA